MTATAKPSTIGDVVTLAQQVLASIKSQMLDDSATSRRAFSDANDAIGALERSVLLANYELVRQHETKKAREAAAAQKAAADKTRADAEERARHMKNLQAEAQREKALRAAREYVQRVQNSK